MAIIFRAAALALLVSLAACGGGDPEEATEADKTTTPVNCKETPKLCI